MDTELKIIEEAERLYGICGLKFTLQDIAAGLHIAKKTIYRYYPSKDDLFCAVIDHAFDAIQAYKRSILNDPSLSMEEKAKQAMIAIPSQYAGMDFRNIGGLSDTYPKAAIRLQERLESDWDPIIELLEEGRKKGVFRSICYPVLRTMVTSSITAFMESDVLEKESVAYNEGLALMMDILMKGIVYDPDDSN